VTKDRRLGRGLAALLGTPTEEDMVVEGTVTARSTNPAPSKTNDSAVEDSLKIAEGTARTSKTDRVTGAVPINSTDSRTRTLELSVYEIDNNPFQPRRKFNEEEIAALAESLKEHKQLQPILVRRVGERYQLISGERRLRATIHAGLKTIRAEVRQADDRLVAELAIVENLQRKDLDAIEKALSFRRYLNEHKCTQEDLAKRLKIDRSTIANLMRLLELPEEIQQWIQSDKLTAGHAKALLPLGDETQQLEFAKRIERESWNVRETERRVTEQLESEDGVVNMAPPKPSSRKRVMTPQIASLEQQLRLSLGTKVEIRQGIRGNGKITVQFANAAEYERIIQLMCPERKSAAA
jgi:ParB family transcriptional regulator, chromosome partitioning protein